MGFTSFAKTDCMEWIGFLAAVFIGISLGLIGGGGSILTVPVLVYLLGVDPVTATAYSLFVVGVTSLVGAIPKYRQGDIDLKTAVIFGLPSILAVFLTRKWILPAIPHNILRISSFTLTKPTLLMLLFATLMVVAAISMMRKPMSGHGENTQPSYNYPLILVEGMVVGMLTGLVGAGGGFLIIPALVLLSRLPMQKAIGTSLLIIGIKSMIGFTGDLGHTTIQWPLLLSVTTLAVLGIFAGNRIGRRIPGSRLRTAFGWLVLVMAVYILFKELF